MTIDCRRVRPIWLDPETDAVKIIDQRRLPHEFVTVTLNTMDDVVAAIGGMSVRGAPLIGVTGAYGMFIAAKSAAQTSDAAFLAEAASRLKSVRPTAVNLAAAVDWVLSVIISIDDPAGRIDAAREAAGAIAAEEVENSRKIGEFGLELIRKIAGRKSAPVQILTHCNAGALACIEYGTATAPVYAAHDAGFAVHVWVDETRPLNQGSRLTAWELLQRGVPHTVITDNAGGHLMQHGRVDLVIVGTDRTTRTGDVANKIGTYLKALAAKDNGVPFYVALPSSSIDWRIEDGVAEIPIEERDPDEIRYMPGKPKTRGHLLLPESSPAANYAFDVTPARLVTGFITERGICKATEADIRRLFPENPKPGPPGPYL